MVGCSRRYTAGEVRLRAASNLAASAAARFAVFSIGPRSPGSPYASPLACAGREIWQLGDRDWMALFERGGGSAPLALQHLLDLIVGHSVEAASDDDHCIEHANSRVPVIRKYVVQSRCQVPSRYIA